MNRTKTFLATGLAPDGRLYAGDLNAIEDAAAALSDFAQTLDLGVLRVGQSDLQLLRYGAGAGAITSEARLTGDLRIDGLFRPLGGMILGTFTTTQRDAIPAGAAPFGTMILNSTLSAVQINTGTDGARVWQSVGGSSVYTTTLGDGVTTDFTVTHSLASRDVLVVVRENAAPYTEVYPAIEFTSTSAIHVVFAVAPTAGQYSITVIGGSGGVQTPSAHASTHHANGSDSLAWGTIHGYGLLSARPAAAATNSGYIYLASDVGTFYRSNGSSWDTMVTDPLLGLVNPATSISAANTDFAAPTAWVQYIAATGAAKSIRTIAAGKRGQRLVFRNTATDAIQLIHNAGAGTGKYMYLRDLADMWLDTGASIEFVYDDGSGAGLWVEVNRDSQLGRSSLGAYSGKNNGSLTAIAMTSSTWDEIGVGNWTANTYATIPNKGKYLIVGYAQTTGQSGSGGGSYDVQRLDSGGTLIETVLVGTIGFNAPDVFSGIVQCNAGDRLSLRTSNGATGTAGTVQGKFAIIRLNPS